MAMLDNHSISQSFIVAGAGFEYRFWILFNFYSRERNIVLRFFKNWLKFKKKITFLKNLSGFALILWNFWHFLELGKAAIKKFNK